jgi:hypothetical protein
LAWRVDRCMGTYVCRAHRIFDYLPKLC